MLVISIVRLLHRCGNIILIGIMDETYIGRCSTFLYAVHAVETSYHHHHHHHESCRYTVSGVIFVGM